MHKEDDGYQTDDNEIGKNLLSIEESDSVEDDYIFNITVKSLIVVNELNELQSLWNIREDSVSKLLKDELLAL